MRKRFMRILPVLLMLTIVALMAGAIACTPSQPAGTTPSEPVLEITKGNVSKSLSMTDIKALPVTEWTGCLRHENGPVEGPFRMKGVTILDLCFVVGGMEEDEAAEADAPDGFAELPYKNIVENNFKTYDAVTGKEVLHGNLVVLLAYEQDGKPLNEDSGPFRVAILGGDNVATQGYMWMKQISKVKVHKWGDYYGDKPL